MDLSPPAVRYDPNTTNPPLCGQTARWPSRGVTLTHRVSHCLVVKVEGRLHNLREKAYVTWTGCYGKLQRAVGERHSPAPWEGTCPLCNAQYEH